jgi:GNAT superfamily N-acetyltransferase
MRAHEFEPVSEKINHDITEKNWHAETTINLPKVGELILRGRNLSHIHPPQFTVEVFTPENKSIAYFRFLVLDWEKPKTGWFAPKPKKDPYVIGGNISVWDEYQKKGIARAVYQWVKSLGNDIRPSTTQTAAGKSMWRSFEKNPLDEAKTTREDFKGMTIEMVRNGHVLVINALDDWGNNVLGSVAFNIGDDNDLDPQDLKVDERYQGQGIAKIMYDYAKSKGYKIHRSYDQTDAGAGFWNKHRGEDVRVWESFDQPYPIKFEHSEYGDVDALTRLPDGTYLSIMFNQESGHDGNHPSHYSVEFYRNSSQEVTGEGDAYKVFATVIEAIRQFVIKMKPDSISFSASKEPEVDMAKPGANVNPESRAKLYNRLVQRYVGAMGYSVQQQEGKGIINYTLRKSKVGVAEDKQTVTELRDRMYQYLKSIVPNWPDYIVKDWLYANFAKGPTQTANWSFETIGKDIPAMLKDMGLSVNTNWQLVPNMKFTMNMWEPKTLKRLQARAGGNTKSADPMVHIPANDAERHATQAALAKQQGGVRNEPVILMKTAQGYELLEGWHRTIQHFAMYPQGYTGPAWVAVAGAVQENFADGRNPQDKGDSKRYHVPTKSSVSNLRKFAKSHSGRAAQLAHWAANMKAGRAKKK